MRSPINGFQVSQAIHVAACLGIADLLDQGVLTADELAVRTRSHGVSLYRLLRALAAVGLFREEDERRFSLTALGAAFAAMCPSHRRRGLVSSPDHR